MVCFAVPYAISQVSGPHTKSEPTGIAEQNMIFSTSGSGKRIFEKTIIFLLTSSGHFSFFISLVVKVLHQIQNEQLHSANLPWR